MVPTHPCPNCAALRSGHSAPCDACGYPHHARPAPAREARKIKPFQFDLRTLLVCMTVSAITFAALHSRNDERFEVALVLGGILYPIFNFIHQFRRNLAAQNPRDRSAPVD